jgi:hypothetical protein
MSADTWEARLHAKEVERRALEDVQAAERAVRALNAVYVRAVEAHTKAVAADISAHKGYPCDHHGNRLTTIKEAPSI